MNRAQCSICGGAMPGNRQDYPDYPFCSRRCRLADLGRWFGEEYRVPDAAPPDLSTPSDSDDE